MWPQQKLPPARFEGPSLEIVYLYEGTEHYGFNIWYLNRFDIDPRDWPPREDVSEQRYENGIDPEKAFEEMSLKQFVQLFTHRISIWKGRGQHDMFELFCHMVFPRKHERILAYIAIWKIRDGLTNAQLAERVGYRNKKACHLATVAKYWKYIKSTMRQFTKRFHLPRKLAEDILGGAPKEDQLHEEVRELVGG